MSQSNDWFYPMVGVAMVAYHFHGTFGVACVGAMIVAVSLAVFLDGKLSESERERSRRGYDLKKEASKKFRDDHEN